MSAANASSHRAELHRFIPSGARFVPIRRADRAVLRHVQGPAHVPSGRGGSHLRFQTERS